jgi:hypothetical protein
MGEQEHKEANQRMNTVICLSKFEITTRDSYISVAVAWVAHQEPAPSQASFNHFPHTTSSCFFPCRGEADLHKLFDRRKVTTFLAEAMPRHLGGFTSKSSKCYEDCFTKLKCSNHSQRGISLNPILYFSQITQTSLRGVGRSSQRLIDVYFCWWNQHPPKESGKSFYTYPPKTNHWKLVSKIGTFSFESGTSRI